MLPGMGRMNPRMMKQLQKQLARATDEIDATEVIIRTREKELVFTNPSVSAVDMMGQKSWQVVGEPEERPLGGASTGTGPTIPEEDVALVASQAGVSPEAARAALTTCNGEPAEAIIKLMER